MPKTAFIDGAYWVDKKGKQRPIPSQPIAAGYLNNGNIGFVSSIVAETGEPHNFLYEFQNNTWAKVDEKRYSRFDDCLFSQLNGQEVEYWMKWSDKRRIWHNHNLQSSIVESQIDLEDINNQSIFGHKQLTFKISDNKTSLTYWVKPAPYTGIPSIFDVSLILDGKRINMKNGYCETSLAHKYLLLQKFGGDGLYLIDLETGISMFEELKHATWIN